MILSFIYTLILVFYFSIFLRFFVLVIFFLLRIHLRCFGKQDGERDAANYLGCIGCRNKLLLG